MTFWGSRLNLQFRAEFFNMFNHTNFNTPNTVVFASATAGPPPIAGRITATAPTTETLSEVRYDGNMESRYSPAEALAFLWLLWAVSWMAAGAWSDRAVKHAGLVRELPYNIMTAVAVVLLFGLGRLREHDLWRIGPGAAWSMVLLATIGFSFSWWARCHLGRLWSRWIVRKADHRIVQTGPYAFVRHPIYTGISLATLATAAIMGTAFACLGAALMILSWCIKARLEERFLREELGAGAYDAYARRVPMLVPFLKL